MTGMAPFSNRTPSDLTLNALAKVRSTIDGPVIDLTESNPTRCGFEYPADLLHELADSRGLGYAPGRLFVCGTGSVTSMKQQSSRAASSEPRGPVRKENRIR